MLAIEKGVAMPAHWPKGETRYPFSKMEIGDSFLAPRDEEHKVRTSARMAKHRGKGTFSALRVEDGIRVWRVA